MERKYNQLFVITDKRVNAAPESSGRSQKDYMHAHRGGACRQLADATFS